MPRTVRPSGSTASTDQLFYLFIVAGLLVMALGAWLAVALAHPPGYTGGWPIPVALALLTGRIAWTAACSAWLAGEVLVVLAGLAAAWKLTSGHRGRRTRIDGAARSMAKRSEIKHLTGSAAEKKARRLQPRLGDGPVTQGDIGPVLIRDLRTSGRLSMSMEDNALILAGPRVGKTTTIAIPAVVAHPGPAVVTSVRRDIVDDTRGVRETLASAWALKHAGASKPRVWVFDPQNVAKTKQDWWFNPLADVTGLEEAARIANIFAAAERPPDAKVDAHFDTAARQLITRLVLAAAVGGKTLVDVYRWASDPDESRKAFRLLEEAGIGVDPEMYELLELAATELAAARNEPDKMKGSTFGSARTMLSCLANPKATRWITPRPGLPCFNPHTFVTKPDTLYLLTEGGPDSPAPLVGLLVAAVIVTAKDLAAESPNGRLPLPLLAVLDEAANIVRIPELPSWFSHFGGRGIVLMTILQSDAQGRGVWGERGMEAMWSAANHILYLGGSKDAKWLDQVSQLIGEHEITTASFSTSTLTGPSRSLQTRKDRILTVADLAALPTGRAILLSSGTPPILGATVPWWEGPHAAQVRESHDRYTPKGAAVDSGDDDVILPSPQWQP
jgi:type IV secretory pathway TraG/TraD family ATPase VirD4